MYSYFYTTVLFIFAILIYLEILELFKKNYKEKKNAQANFAFT